MLLSVLLSLPGCRQRTLDTADTALCRDAAADYSANWPF